MKRYNEKDPRCKHCFERMYFHMIGSVRVKCERSGGPAGGFGEEMSAEELALYNEMLAEEEARRG